ncbi:ThuA domain-containing protein [bacterium]|nr:ThuA domain-containing protein [bacterium]
MASDNNTEKKGVLSAGLAALAAAAVTPQVHAAPKPKAPGETKIVAVMAHDTNHNGVTQEYYMRTIFESKKDWRLIFARASSLFTPELIGDADLLVTARTGIADPIDLTADPLADSMREGAQLWTDENVKAIINNIRNRGMGFLALHCTIYSRNRDITDLLGIEPIMHNEVQPIWVRDTNQDHPITQGIGRFFINLDEQFAVVIKSEYSTTLFETTAMHDKRNAVGGWCLENGKGRIVGLLPGHTADPYRLPEYQEIVWRAAHWAMRRDIPPYPKAGKSI